MGRKPAVLQNTLTRQQIVAVEMQFNGHKIEDCVLAIFGKRPGDTGYATARKKIIGWNQEPKVQEQMAKLMNAMVYPAVMKAQNKLVTQIDDNNPWVAQGAAREVMNRFGSKVFGEEEKTLSIKIEGMPALGSPDDLEVLEAAPPSMEAELVE